MDETGKIVELLELNKEWSRTTLRDAEFICVVFGWKNILDNHIRDIEGSLDGGMTWKTRYEDELVLLGKDIANSIRWRVKEE